MLVVEVEVFFLVLIQVQAVLAVEEMVVVHPKMVLMDLVEVVEVNPTIVVHQHLLVRVVQVL
jgi:hypothetical protein|tara:strand:- start:27 stop:212 length:186 start_codon:yes stop_codon:yes gene_type:complete